MDVTTLSAPSAEPLSLAEAKAYLRIGHGGEDDLVARLIAAARARIEAGSGVALITRTLRGRLDRWPPGALEMRTVRLPVRPALGLAAVRVAGADGVLADVTDRFRLDAGRAARLVWASGAFPWPGVRTGGIEIDWTAGFGPAPEDVAADLGLALKRLIAHAYLAREAETLAGPLPEDVRGLLGPWRRVRL